MKFWNKSRIDIWSVMEYHVRVHSPKRIIKGTLEADTEFSNWYDENDSNHQMRFSYALLDILVELREKFDIYVLADFDEKTALKQYNTMRDLYDYITGKVS